MNRISGFVIIVLVVLFASMLVAGCTNSAPVNNSSVKTSATTITPITTALYSAGDIVRSPKSAAETGYLILKYDAGSDSYERAFIYRNDDGSWGYRLDSQTLTLSRSAFEKVNTVKVTHVDPSLVSLKKPLVTVATPSVTATKSLVTTKTPAMKPQIKGITPESGMAGTTVSISDLHGDGFQSGASVLLVRTASDNISATTVNVLSLSQISCTFSLPVNATIGIWDLLVTNPDGQSVRYTNGFTVRANSNPTATTTSLAGGIPITSISPPFLFSKDQKPITVQGSNFKDGITCKLIRSGKPDIIAYTVYRTSEEEMQCFFTIPAGSMGAWSLVLKNSDGTTGTLTDGLPVNG
jgi:outer membrane murein-binding lipoprotein Lpp